MITAAMIDEAGAAGRLEKSFFESVKRKTGADRLLIVTGGSFTQDGRTVKTDKYERAEMLRSQGADLVVELPVYCTLTTSDTFAFAAVSLLEKLNCVDQMVIVTEDVCPEKLFRIAGFLFEESAGYQADIKACRASGMDFRLAQASVTERYIPGAGKILLCETNRKAAEYLKAMKRMYSTMQVCLYNIEEEHAGLSGLSPEGKGDIRTGHRLAAMFRDLLASMTHGQRTAYLNETAGGFGPKTERILEMFEKNEVKDLEQLAEHLTTADRSAADARRYLLRALLGIRQVDISICGLYSYAVYGRVLGSCTDSLLFDQVKASSRIPVFSETDGGEDEAEKLLDDSGRILTGIDRRALELHRGIYNPI